MKLKYVKYLCGFMTVLIFINLGVLEALSLPNKTIYKPATVKYDPHWITGFSSVRETLSDPFNLQEWSWKSPKEVEDLFTISNIINPDSTLLISIRKFIGDLDTETKRMLLTFYSKQLHNIPSKPPYMGEKLFGVWKIITCPLPPQSTRNLAWILSCIGEPAINILVTYLRSDEDVIWEARAGAAEALGWMGTPAVESLLSALTHESLRVRIRASAALHKIGDPQYYPQIMESLTLENQKQSGQEPKMYESIDESQIIDRFLFFLVHEEESVRGNAAWALGYIESPRAVDPLILLLEEEDMGDAQLAAEALGYLGDERAVTPLILKLKNPKLKWGKHAPLHWKIARALARFGDAAFDPLVNILQDEELHIRNIQLYAGSSKPEPFYYHGARITAVRALAWLDLGKAENGKSFEPLLKALLNENKDIKLSIRVRNLRVQVEAAKALGQLGDLRAVEPLINALQDDFYLVRASAAWALGELGDNRAVNPLLELYNDKNETIKLTAVSSLVNIDEQKGCDLLIEMLLRPKKDYNQAWLDIWIARKLVEMKSVAIDPLISELNNEESHSKVIGILGMMKDKRAVDHIVKWLHNKYKFNRKCAAWSLGEIGDEQAVPYLIEALEDKNANVRKNAAWALGKIGDSRAVEALISTFQKKKEKISVRQNATWALGKIGDPRAVEVLIKALRNYNVRTVAYWSLKQISEEDFGIGTTEAIENWEKWYETQKE